MIDQLIDRHSVAWLSLLLASACSGLYVWRLGEEVPVQRVPENVAITTEFMAMFHEHLSIFGSPRIHQVLLALGRHD